MKIKEMRLKSGLERPLNQKEVSEDFLAFILKSTGSTT
ncbi:hypothetical protein SAMN06269250_2768 [Spirosoma fluviale]|uniref:Uncharacterized protein n=1 Tax=Spirosoma fluviale TaxID=1597977 RepID=A0A286FZF1_9BACT|nr:hypothetical protein SAMN06269250_2768 [Spirosoma fluviale]